MSKNSLSSLLSTLLGPPLRKAEEVKSTWYLCVPDGSGGVQRYDTTSVEQVEMMARQWLASGWPAWVEDDKGQTLHIAHGPREFN